MQTMDSVSGPRHGCGVDGCGKVHYAKGWCAPHYMRFRRHGDPLAGGPSKGEAPAFLKNVVLTFVGEDCLPWPFGKDSDGYGEMWRDGKMCRVTRIVCEAEHGPPPTSKHEAAHSCGKGHEGCVNRKHLAWKTRAENQADRLAHGTHSRGERSCHAKLTAAQVLEIRASAKPYRELAGEYGIAQSTVSEIKARKRWAWLEDAA